MVAARQQDVARGPKPLETCSIIRQQTFPLPTLSRLAGNLLNAWRLISIEIVTFHQSIVASGGWQSPFE